MHQAQWSPERPLPKQYRDEHSLTMQQLADRCHLSKSYISMLERGRHPQNRRLLVPSLDTFKKLSEGMQIPLDLLLSLIDAQDWVDNGFDVDTGSSFPLDPVEMQLIEDYRDASEEIRGAAITMLRVSAEANRKGGSVKDVTAG